MIEFFTTWMATSEIQDFFIVELYAPAGCRADQVSPILLRQCGRYFQASFKTGILVGIHEDDFVHGRLLGWLQPNAGTELLEQGLSAEEGPSSHCAVSGV